MQTYNSTFTPALHKPTVLYFTAPWCVPCKRFGPVMDKVAEAVFDVDFVKVDADEFFEAASKYNVKGLPTLVYVEDGGVHGTLVGAHNSDAVLSWLDKVGTDE